MQENHDEHLMAYDGDEEDHSPLWHSLSSPGKCGAPWFLCTAPDTLPGSDWRRQTGREDEPCTAAGQRVKQGGHSVHTGLLPSLFKRGGCSGFYFITGQHKSAVIFLNINFWDYVFFFNNVFLVTWFEYSGAKGRLGAASQCSVSNKH